MNEIRSKTNPVPPVEILRHRAAIRRSEPSLPLKCLIRDNLLTDGTTFFDYGCGYGDDLEQVKRLGFVANGWDPAYRPDEAVCEADVVNLGYVINVIEDQSEREDTLRAAWRMAKKVFAVAARIAVDGTGDGEFEFGDGVITRIQTFQKYYSQAELRQYLEQILGAEAIPAAPGVFYLFKDPALRESFSASKYRRRSFAPRRRASEVEFDRHRELLEELIRISADLARLPFEDEFDRTAEVITIFGSLRRAFKLIRKVTGSDPWDTLRQSRIDDLRVYLALARFPKRPSFSRLPVGMQRDIKEFFGGYKSACDSADVLLFESGRTELVDAACQRSKIGRLTSNALYLHRSAISALEPILRVFEGCANAYLGDVEDANVVKLHRFSGKISYLACPRFETHPHPPVRRTIKLSLRNLFLQCIDHTENKNPLLLDRKERMIEADHPWQQRFARFSLLEAQHGLIDDSTDMRLALQWHAKLQEAGMMIKGNRLRYQDGVKRKRLPPKHLFLEPQGEEQEQVVPQKLPEEDIDSELHDATAVEAIDSDLEDYTSASDSRPAELPTRSRRYGVGKEIGYAVYVHRDYEDRLGPTVEWAKRHLPEHYEYSVVKLNLRNDSVSFIHCPGFDLEHEPVIAAIVVVAANGHVQRRAMPSDPYIYHHKWLFVADDYQGFDLAESKSRSEQWSSIGEVDRSRIGRKNFWEQYVVPKLWVPSNVAADMERARTSNNSVQSDDSWHNSKEIRLLLKISTCELTHLRLAGKIEFEKIGRAYRYRRTDGRNSNSR
ncbi:MAG: DNA phosphorothioation-associated putative methyltransferase [Planctomycetota bacterium]|nr:DNA phosphorothioation-associated putative methyltransferase [Planctomycetota bacterium]